MRRPVAPAPRAVIVVTGSELVRGGRRDANGPFLARELTRLGLEPEQILLVGDRSDDLEACVREALRADVCLLSGGLGPTHDDRTIELLASAAGRPLVVDENLEREIDVVSRAAAERRGRSYADFAAGVLKQATLPEEAIALGLAGTAPAVLLEHEGRVAVALPGPPGELRRLWPLALASAPLRRILERARPRTHRTLRFFGPSESAVARALEEAGGEGSGVEVTVCAHELEIHVDVFVDDGGSARADSLEQELRRRFGDELFTVDERPVEELVLALCRELGLTLATAESCTGGLVGARLTSVAGASDVYVGGVVAYADSVKREALGVPEALLARHGAVSAEVARAMAAGARATLAADVGIAVTGIAGPGGGTEEKPVGLVFFHVETPHGDLGSTVQLPGDREAVRARATTSVLHLLRRLLTQTASHPRALAG